MKLHRFDATRIDNHDDRGIDDEYEHMQTVHEFAEWVDFAEEVV